MGCVIIVAEDRARVDEAYTRWIAQPDASLCTAEYRVESPDGSRRWILDRGRALRDASGAVYRVAGMAEDMSERKLAELSAERSRRDFRELVENLPPLTWGAGIDGRCDYLSPQWLRYTGMPQAELLGIGWFSVVHPEERRRLARRWQHAVAVGTACGVELRLRRADGQYRWFALRAAPVCDESGRVQRWLGTCTDVHELKQTGAALAEQRDRFAEVARGSPSAIHSFCISPDGHRSFPFGAECSAVSSAALQLDFRIRHPQHGERWIEAHSMPSFESDGSRAWHGALTDITERKQAERALRASQAQLEAVFEDLTEGLITYRIATRQATFNRAALELHRLAGPADVPPTLEAYQQMFELRLADGSTLANEDWPLSKVLRGERVAKYVVHLHHLVEGWETVLSFGGSLVRDAEGQPLLAVLLMSDVTDRHRYETALQRLNAELEDRITERTSALTQAVEEMESFSYSVSHDLRAPLRALDGFSQAVMQDCAELLPETGRQYLQIIRDSAKKMGQLIDDLLAFSRLSRAPLNKRPIDPAMLVRDALSQLAPMREGRHFDLRIDDLPPCRGDLALLRQVWINLISNALKYTRHRALAVIEIGSRRDEAGRAVYFVRDNGTGFDMRYVHKLFGVFERLHRAEDFEGTGVGLAIVKRIVQRHGGEITAQGRPDLGASFHFYLGED